MEWLALLRMTWSFWYTKICPRNMSETPSCLDIIDITMLGMGHMVGAEIYVWTMVAHDVDTTRMIFRLLVAGFAFVMAMFCCAEPDTRIPKMGNVYFNIYNDYLGKLLAFGVGTYIIMTHVLGTVFVAKTWSGYVNSLMGDAVNNYTRDKLDEWIMGKYSTNNVPDILAFGLCLVCPIVLGLEVKTKATVNSLITIINLAVIGLLIILGIYYADIVNWSQIGLLHAFENILVGAATNFFVYVGFISIATFGEEARDPTRNILPAMINTIVLAFTCVLMNAAVKEICALMDTQYMEINEILSFPKVFSFEKIPWTKYVLSVGALCGMTTTLFCFMRMMCTLSNDDLLFGFSVPVEVHPYLRRIKHRLMTFCNFTSGVFISINALTSDIQNLMNCGLIGLQLIIILVIITVILLLILSFRQAVAVY